MIQADDHIRVRSVKLETQAQTLPSALKTFFVQKLAQRAGSQLNRNIGAGSIMALIGSFLSFISYPIYLHYLGYHAYGLWLVLGVIVSVAQLGNLGIPWALTKLVAEDHGRGDWEGVRTYIGLGCGVILVVGLVFIAAITISRYSILRSFKLSGPDAAMVFSMLPYVAALSVLVLLFSTLNAALGGLGRMDLTSYNETIVQILVVAVSSLLLWLGLGLWAMVWGSLACYLVGQIISFLQVWRLMPVPLLARISPRRHKISQLFTTGGWILSGGICTALLLPASRLMLSRYAGLEVVAINDLCVTSGLRIRNVFDAAFRPMMPEVSAFKVKENANVYNRIHSIDRKTRWIALSVALPCFAVVVIGTNPLLHLWLHRSFNPLLSTPFRIALAGAFMSLLGSSAYYMLIGFGKASDSAFSAAIQLLVNIAVLIVIAIMNGRITVVEAAIAFAAATSCSTLFLRIRLGRLVRPSLLVWDSSQ